MSGLLGIYIKTLYDGVFIFSQTVFICRFLEASRLEHFNVLSIPTISDPHLVTF